MGELKRSHIQEVAAIFGKKLGEPFVVDDGTGLKPAKIMFTTKGIEHTDGKFWHEANFFLPALIMGKCWEAAEYDQGSLFD